MLFIATFIYVIYKWIFSGRFISFCLKVYCYFIQCYMYFKSTWYKLSYRYKKIFVSECNSF